MAFVSTKDKLTFSRSLVNDATKYNNALGTSFPRGIAISL